MAGMLWAFLFTTGVFGPRAAAFVSADGDLALHILLGDLVREQGSVLATEPTTFTADQTPFIAHEWLSEVIFSAAHSLLGLSGPLVIVAALVAITGWLAMRRMRESGVSGWPQVLVVVCMMMLMNQHLSVRPHVFSWLIALFWTVQLEGYRSDRISWQRWLLVCGPLMVLWTNLHGGFVLGFVLLGLFGLDALLLAVGADPDERRLCLGRFGRC
jgi:hypothetical protein